MKWTNYAATYLFGTLGYFLYYYFGPGQTINSDLQGAVAEIVRYRTILDSQFYGFFVFLFTKIAAEFFQLRNLNAILISIVVFITASLIFDPAPLSLSKFTIYLPLIGPFTVGVFFTYGYWALFTELKRSITASKKQ